MAYSKVPEQYESMFMMNGKGQALDTKRKHEGGLCNTDEDYDNSSEEDMEMALQILAEKKKAKKKRKGIKGSATKVLGKGKKGEKRIKRKGTLRSSD